MTGLVLEVQLAPQGFAELEGDNIKFWLGYGLPTYEGSLEGFAEAYPAQFAELLKRKIIKPRE